MEIFLSVLSAIILIVLGYFFYIEMRLRRFFKKGEYYYHLGQKHRDWPYIDREKAFQYLNTSCQLGYARGCIALAEYSATWGGLSVVEQEASLEKAFNILSENCKNGDAESCYELGRIYDSILPSVVKPDVVKGKKLRDKAVDLYTKSCENGNAESCYKLSEIYIIQEWSLKDKEQSEYYCDRALTLGYESIAKTKDKLLGYPENWLESLGIKE